MLLYIFLFTGCNYKKKSGFHQPIIKAMMNKHNLCGFPTKYKQEIIPCIYRDMFCTGEDSLLQHRVIDLPV
jgi:hypothetical protein